MSTELCHRDRQPRRPRRGYGIPGVTVDGNDVQAVHDAVVARPSRAPGRGEGPTLVEA